MADQDHGPAELARAGALVSACVESASPTNHQPNIEGGGVDKIRMKIWNKNTGAIVYDKQPGAPDNATPTMPVGSGSSIDSTLTQIRTLGAGGGIRTRMPLARQGILSPLRLPVPPP